MINLEYSKVSTLNIEEALKTMFFMARGLKRQKTIILKVCTITVKKWMELSLGKMITIFTKDHLKIKSLTEKAIWLSQQDNIKAIFILV